MRFLRFPRPGAIVASVTALLVLAACGQDDPSGSDGSAVSTGWEPEGRVTMIVPFDAGGGTDTMGRAIASGLEEVRPGLEVVVENRPGAGGATGYTYVAQREGDPLTLVTVESGVVTGPLVTDVDFDYSDFTSIGQVSEHVSIVAAQAGRFEDLQDAMTQGESSPLVLAMAGGQQSIFSMMATSLEEATSTDFDRVGFDTGSEAIRAVIAGDADLAVVSPEHATEFIRAEDVDGLGVLTDSRIDIGVLTEVPTAKEQGIEAVFAGVRGLSAAPGLSGAEATYWREAFMAWTETDSYDKYIESTESLAMPLDHEAYNRNLADFQQRATKALTQLDGE